MSDARLTPKQQLLFWELLTRGGSALQKDVKPDAKDRIALEGLGFITTSREGRKYRLELTDRGWRALGEMEASLFGDDKPRPSSDRRILQIVLSSLSRYARAEGIALYEIFRPSNEEAPKPNPLGEAGREIEDEIRDAFFELAGRPPRDRVRLSALRSRLRHVPRRELDGALIAMRERRTANLANLDNPRDIESEGDAALLSGIHVFHTLWIDA